MEGKGRWLGLFLVLCCASIPLLALADGPQEPGSEAPKRGTKRPPQEVEGAREEAAKAALQALGLDPEVALPRLQGGELLSVGLESAVEEEIAASVVALVPRAMADVVRWVQEGDALLANRDVQRFGFIDQPPIGRNFVGIELRPDEDAAEIDWLLEAGAGEKLNLSTAELAGFRALQEYFAGDRCSRTPECVAAVEEQLREVLLARSQAYMTRGLAGIAPYARSGNRSVSAASELKADAAAARQATRHLPGFRGGFLEYPTGRGGGVTEFVWIQETTEQRRNFVLSHRMFDQSGDGAIIAERQYYVAHSYNSMQAILGCIPMGEGTLLFFTKRVSADQVAGAAEGTRHAVGRKRLIQEVSRRIEEFRDAGTGG